MKDAVWVIIPAYNEAAYLNKVLRKVSKKWSRFIVVDDGSSDSTTKISQKYTKHVLTHAVNLGKGAALKTGCEYAFRNMKAAGVIFFDGDDQHDADLLPTMAKKLEQYPVVLGVRSFNNQMPLIRILFNRLASVITLIFFGNYIPDIPCGYKALNKNAYQKVSWTSTDYLVEMEIAARIAQHHIPFTEISIPTIYHDLDRGMTVLDILHMAGKVLSWKVSK